MKLQDYKMVFITIGLIGILLISLPVSFETFHLVVREQNFTEFYLLGANHLSENFPYRISVGQNYTIYSCINNHLGSAAYYILYITLGNETTSFNSNNLGNSETSFPLAPTFETRFAIQNGVRWENQITFLVSKATFLSNGSIIENFQINNNTFNVYLPLTQDNFQILFQLATYPANASLVSSDMLFTRLHLSLTNPMD